MIPVTSKSQGSNTQASNIQFLAHALDAKSGTSGFTEEHAYRCTPQTQYQLWSRHNMTKEHGVKYHYTQTFSASVVER